MENIRGASVTVLRKILENYLESSSAEELCSDLDNPIRVQLQHVPDLNIRLSQADIWFSCPARVSFYNGEFIDTDSSDKFQNETEETEYALAAA
jgi:hypothetical protein